MGDFVYVKAGCKIVKSELNDTNCFEGFEDYIKIHLLPPNCLVLSFETQNSCTRVDSSKISGYAPVFYYSIEKTY